MSANVELLTAYVSLVPTMKNIQGTAAQALAPMVGESATVGEKAGGALSSGISGVMSKAALGGAAIGALALGTGKALYGIGATFDDVSDTIRVGTGASGAALAGLETVAKQVGTSVPTSFEAAGQTVADLNTRLGLSGDTLKTVASQYLEAGRILGQDVDVKTTTAAFSAFGVQGKAVEGAMDSLFQVSQATGVGMNKLASTVQTSAVPMKNLGFSFSETAALAGTLDKAGLNSQQVMASMNKGLVTLAKAGEQPQAAFKRITGELQGFIAKGDTAGALNLAAKIFGTKGAAQFVGALQSGKVNLDSLTKSAGLSGDTILKVGQETADAAESWQLLKNKALAALQPLGTAVFNLAGKGLGLLVDGFDKVQSALAGVDFKGALGGIGQVFAPIGQALGQAFSTLGPVLSGLLPLFLQLWQTLSPTSIAFKALTPVIPMIADAIAQLVTGLAPLVSMIATTGQQLLAALIPAFMSLVQALMPLVPIVMQVVTSLLPPLMGIFNALVPVILQVVQAIAPLVSMIASLLIPIISALMPVVQTVFGVIASIITSVMQIVQGVIQVVTGIISGDWSMVWTGIQNIFSGIWNTIVNIVSGVINIIGYYIQAGLGLWQGIISTVLNAIGGFFSNIFNAIGSTVGNTFAFIGNLITFSVNLWQNIISNVLNAIGGLFSSTWNNIVNGVTGFFRTAGAYIQAGMTLWWGTVTAVLNNIRNFFNSIFGAVRATVSNAISFVSGIISGGLNTVRNIVSSVLGAVGGFFSSTWNNVINGVSGFIGNMISYFTSLPGKILGALAGAGGWLLDVGRNIIQGLINGITGAIGGAINAVKDGINGIIGGAKDLLGIHSPSRVFRDQVGAMIPAGAALGISDNAGLMQDAADKAFASIVGQPDLAGLAGLDLSAGIDARAAAYVPRRPGTVPGSTGAQAGDTYIFDGQWYGDPQHIADQIEEQKRRENAVSGLNSLLGV